MIEMDIAITVSLFSAIGIIILFLFAIWGWLEKTCPVIWRWIRRTWQRYYVGGIIGMICLGVGIVVAIPFMRSISWNNLFSPKMLNPDLVRNYIFFFGGLGALYGVAVSSRRARTAASQLFNERLGRGADLLANAEINIRRTGIRVLEDLAKKATDEERKLIIQVIQDFAHAQADKFKEEELKMMASDKTKLDIELAIKTVIILAESSEISKEEIHFEKINLSQLSFGKLKTNLSISFFGSILNEVDFSFVKLIGTDFRYAELNRAYFTLSELNETDFRAAKLNGTNFNDAELKKTNFNDAELKGASFQGAELKKVSFYEAKLNGANFVNVELNEVNFRDAELNGSYFRHSELKTVNFRDADCSDVDFMGAVEITQNQVNGMLFERGKEPILPEGLEIPKSRAYTWQKDEDGETKRRFVKSDAEWSENWIEVIPF